MKFYFKPSFIALLVMIFAAGTVSAQDAVPPQPQTLREDDALPPVMQPESVNPVSVETPVEVPVSQTSLPEASVLPTVPMQRPTHPEKIVFAQIKLAGVQPDLDAFAKASPIVQQAQDIDKSTVAISEYNRLQNAFSLYDVKKEIVVHTTLKVDEYSSIQDLLVFDEFDPSTFFRFGIYDYNVGIVPEDIVRFSRLQLSKERADYLFKTLGGTDKVMAEFVLMPTYADVREPFIKANINFWLMFARVAEFRLWSDSDPKDAKLLWYYRAPWYQKQDNTGVSGLSGNPDK